MQKQVRKLTYAAITASLYLALTMLLAPVSFGMIQFRLSEALAVFPVFTPAAVPGLILGCFLSNLLNPQNLGPIDIFGGTAATGLAAYLTYRIGRIFWRRKKQGTGELWIVRIAALLPPVLINALIVGTYLPFLLTEGDIDAAVIITSVFSIFASQTIVIYAIGLPLMLGLERTPLASMDHN